MSVSVGRGGQALGLDVEVLSFWAAEMESIQAAALADALADE